MSSLTNLPEDVLINRILLKLDTDSLVNLRCVCKNLRNFITNPDFVKMHCHDQFNNNNNNNPLVLVSLKKICFCSLSFNGNDIHLSCPKRVEISTPFRLPRFIGFCNGLLCLVDKLEINQNLCLWNPSTKEYKKLLPPLPVSLMLGSDRLTPYFSYGFGYDRIINDYKVILCHNFSFGHRSLTRFQVYTLGTDTWREIDKNPYKSYCMAPYGYGLAGVFVSGGVHWIGYYDRGSRIIAFDIENEMFRAEVPIPCSRLINHFSKSCSLDSLDVLRGCLCIYETRAEHNERMWMDVWMMKEYGMVDSWTKLFTIKDCSAFKYPSSYDFKVLKFCESGEFLVSMNHRDHKILVLYDPINQKRRKVKFGKIASSEGCMEIHIKSLVSLKTGIYMDGVKKQVLEGETEDEYALEEEEEKQVLEGETEDEYALEEEEEEEEEDEE